MERRRNGYSRGPLARVIRIFGRRMAREDGAMLVETGIAATSLLMVLFGMIEICWLLYSYNYVSNAARDATRYAVLRGPNSCNDATVTPFPDCGLKPTKFTSTTDPTKNPLLNYVESMGYPALSSSNTSMQVTYLVATKTAAGATTWATDSHCSSTSDTDTNGNPCNNVGNMINVQVTYNFPLNVPFWKQLTVPVTSTSQMMISE